MKPKCLIQCRCLTDSEAGRCDDRYRCSKNPPFGGSAKPIVSGALPLTKKQLLRLVGVGNTYTYLSGVDLDEPKISEDGIKRVIEIYELIRRQ